MERGAAKWMTKVRRELERERAARALEVRAHAPVGRAGDGLAAPGGDEADQAAAFCDAQLQDVAGRRAAASLRLVEAALRRFDAGRYGRCLHCGEAIPGRRLLAVPTAVLCRECQEAAERLRAVACRGLSPEPHAALTSA